MYGKNLAVGLIDSGWYPGAGGSIPTVTYHANGSFYMQLNCTGNCSVAYYSVWYTPPIWIPKGATIELTELYNNGGAYGGFYFGAVDPGTAMNPPPLSTNMYNDPTTPGNCLFAIGPSWPSSVNVTPQTFKLVSPYKGENGVLKNFYFLIGGGQYGNFGLEMMLAIRDPRIPVQKTIWTPAAMTRTGGYRG